MSRVRILQWAVDGGHVILQWPEGMSPDDASEARDAVLLACRSFNRTALQGTSFTQFEARLRRALDELPAPAEVTP